MAFSLAQRQHKTQDEHLQEINTWKSLAYRTGPTSCLHVHAVLHLYFPAYLHGSLRVDGRGCFGGFIIIIIIIIIEEQTTSILRGKHGSFAFSSDFPISYCDANAFTTALSQIRKSTSLPAWKKAFQVCLERNQGPILLLHADATLQFFFPFFPFEKTLFSSWKNRNAEKIGVLEKSQTRTIAMVKQNHHPQISSWRLTTFSTTSSAHLHWT